LELLKESEMIYSNAKCTHCTHCFIPLDYTVDLDPQKNYNKSQRAYCKKHGKEIYEFKIACDYYQYFEENENDVIEKENNELE